MILAGLTVSAVWRGRVMELPTDLGEAFTAAITGDYADLKDVLTRKGDGLIPTPVAVSSETATGTASAIGSTLLSEMKRLAVIADNTYSLGTTGPKSFDCSGLVWRALRNLGTYSGSRFTTATFVLAARSFAKPVNDPRIGDIVLWPRHHMGVVSGNDLFYSARNRKSGIGESRISTFRGAGSTIRYFRIDTFSLNPNEGKAGSGLGVDL